MFIDKLKKIHELKLKLSKYKLFLNDELIKYLENYYHVRLTYSSNYIEGFTYTEEETFNLIFNNQTADFKSALETGAVRAHDQCFRYMMELQTGLYLEERDVLKFHELLAGGLENDAIPGRYRTGRVQIAGKEFISPDRVPGAMKMMFRNLEEAREKEYNPILLALRYHKDIVFIHPFMDGNGRVARLAMNTIMLQNNYLPIDIPPEKRSAYHQSIKNTYTNPNSFFQFMLDQAIDSHQFMLVKLTNDYGESLNNRRND
ncbi:MAG: Fic family protein [Deltaproteobacteria bacterium]|jgi:Fic family protein|nr:Fic family protein [Deltaproteobacteria bacterium]